MDLDPQGERSGPVEPELVTPQAAIAAAIPPDERLDFPAFVRRYFPGADPQNSLEAVEASIEVQRKLTKATINLSRPGDWLAMGDKLYFQSIGSERANQLWGMVYGTPKVEHLSMEDGTFLVRCTGPVYSVRAQVLYLEMMGGRWSGDEFFDRFTEDKPAEWFKRSSDGGMTAKERRQWRMEHRLPINPADVEKAARTNWLNNCFTRVAGLRGLTISDLRAEGYARWNEIKVVEFKAGAKGGGGASAGGLVLPAKFGPDAGRGKPINADLPDDVIAFWIKNCSEQLNNPEKAQFATRNRKMLEALKAAQADKASK